MSNSLRCSHRMPLYKAIQLHVNVPSLFSEHVPPFLQGLASQEVTRDKKRVTRYCDPQGAWPSAPCQHATVLLWANTQYSVLCNHSFILSLIDIINLWYLKPLAFLTAVVPLEAGAATAIWRKLLANNHSTIFTRSRWFALCF